jgi:serine/threonine protein kinase
MNYQNNSNYNNFYLNYENYGMNNQQINLYNFNSQNYSIIKVLGKGSNGKIYLVQDMQTQQRFALKSMLIDNEMDLKEKEEQYNLIYRLTYENPELKIVNIYGLEVRKVDKFNTFLNVLMEKGEYDWETEISRRIKTKNYYTEDELFYILSNLVATFAILQQKGVSHRDVKPQNILCFGNNEYKICDFGEAKYKDRMKFGNNFNNLDSSNQTIRGTEMYMSPILFRAVKSRPDSLTKYNSFKSDVFSLGLCFLYAGSLDLNVLFKVRDVLDMQRISIIVNQYLGRLYSQEFIGLLIYMLQVDEKYRPDFIELNSWIVYGNY